MGNKRVTQRGLEVVDVRPRREPAAAARLRARPEGLHRRDQDGRLMAAPQAPYIGKKTGKVALDEAVFGERFHEPLVHRCVVAELNAKRTGTASTLTRGEVAMTGAKAWRQKGTGRARVGALSAPQRTGGGVTFGPKPRCYTVKVNRKARRRALRAALSVHAARGSLAAVDAGALSTSPRPRGRGGCRELRRRPRAGGAGRRRGERRPVLPQHRGRQRAARRRRRRGRRDRRVAPDRLRGRARAAREFVGAEGGP